MERIKITRCLAAFLALGLGLLARSVNAQDVVVPPSVLNSSKISLSNPTFDFGTVSEGAVVEHEFKFKNEGKSNLVIQRVVPACGCTAAASSTEPVLPGAESSIKVSLDTSGMDGERTKTIQVYTNDPDKTTLGLSMHGVIQKDVKVEPSQLSFGEVSRGEEKAGDFTVTIRGDSGVTFKNAQSFSKLINVRESQQKSETLKRFTVTLSKDLPIGPFRDRVIINTIGKDGKERPMNLPVFADVSGSIKLNPSNVSFGIIEGNSPLSRSVKLENSGKIPLEVIGVQSKSDAVSTEVKEISKGKAFVVKLTLDPSKITSDLRTSIVIQTNIEESKELTLNVYGVRSATSNG